MPADVAHLPGIESRAGERFRELGMDRVADDAPLSVAELTVYVDAGRAFVATDDGRPVGYLLTDPVDGAGHVEQVSVDPGYAGRRHGRSLLDAAATWSRSAGYSRQTLCTFADVPWNAPWYVRCGFRTLADDELGPGLLALRRREAELGLDRWSRVCMARDL